jgi:predicted O-methyltransferase YrrM
MSNIRHKAILTTHPDVMMDDCHIDLIHALVLSAKPKSILEIGIGSGATTLALLDAVKMNGNGATVTCVDNFGDWNGHSPEGFDRLPAGLRFVLSSEEGFVKSTDRTFDFVVSDADHAHTGEWFKETLALVNPGGILIYHDATSPHCPSVCSVVDQARAMVLPLMIFNKSSQPWEQCERGLLIIKKP